MRIFVFYQLDGDCKLYYNQLEAYWTSYFKGISIVARWNIKVY